MVEKYTAIADLEQLDDKLSKLYGPAALPLQQKRYQKLLEMMQETFGSISQVALFSAPGRTEIGGNHTDHQHGNVLAGSVNLDMIAAVSPNGDDVIRVQSEGYPLLTVDLSDLRVRAEEKNTSTAIIRGIVSWFSEHGCDLEGFDACVMSSVPKGSGLSSSAAFEVLIANIFNDLFFESKCSPVQLAQIGQYAENVYFGKPSGLLDQMASSVGATVTVDFMDNENPIVERVNFDFASAGHALCIIDSGTDHADLTDEYAAIPGELKQLCALFGKEVLREIPEEIFFAELPRIRGRVPDRAILRAIHIYQENKRVLKQVAALKDNDFDAFLALVKESGRSSWMYLQNITPAGAIQHQNVAVALALCDTLLDDRGAYRVHGGGFAGTVQAFVPLDMLDGFKTNIEAVLGKNTCHVLSIRPEGGIRVL